MHNTTLTAFTEHFGIWDAFLNVWTFKNGSILASLNILSGLVQSDPRRPLTVETEKPNVW